MLDPNEFYILEEDGETKSTHPCLLTCLDLARGMGLTTKVRRGSDGLLLAYKQKLALTDAELKREAASAKITR